MDDLQSVPVNIFHSCATIQLCHSSTNTAMGNLYINDLEFNSINFYKEKQNSQAFWLKPVIIATEKDEHKNYKFRACLGYRASSRTMRATHILFQNKDLGRATDVIIWFGAFPACMKTYENTRDKKIQKHYMYIHTHKAYSCTYMQRYIYAHTNTYTQHMNIIIYIHNI